MSTLARRSWLRDLTAGLPQVSLVQADLLKLPFEAASFDLIYSLGVLDHTPDPRASFLALAGLLKPGGRIVVWVYPLKRPLLESIMNLERLISTRLPVRWLEFLCRLAAPVGGLKAHGWLPAAAGGSGAWEWLSTLRPLEFRCTPTPRSAFATRSIGTLPDTCRGIPLTRSPSGSARLVYRPGRSQPRPGFLP